MAIIDKIKVDSTTYDVSPSASGTLNTTGTTKFTSSDTAQASATSWTNVARMTTADNHATLFTKITKMAKNVRYLYNVLGTGFSTRSTVKSQIDSKAPANHSHSVSQLPTSSTQVNSNDYIPTSALIYSMNQTLTSLNDASTKIKIDNIYPNYNISSSNDNYYLFNKGILINAYMWETNTSQSIPLIQIYKNKDTVWIIKVIKVYKSETNGSIANSNGIYTKITIYYI